MHMWDAHYKQLVSVVEQVSLQVAELKGQRTEKRRLLKHHKAIIVKEQHQAAVFDQVSALLEQVGEVARLQTKQEIEALITHGLRSVLEDSHITFQIALEYKRKQLEARFGLMWDDDSRSPIWDIPNEAGGGIADVISVLLRLVLLELLCIEGPLVLDEPAKMLSTQHIPAFGQLLSQLSKRFGRQMIVVTHNQDLVNFADKRFQVSLNSKAESIVESL